MERQTNVDRPQAGEGRRYVGHWPDRETYGKALAEDLGLTDYMWEIPQVLRPYMVFDYERVIQDMCEVGGLDVVETPDGVHVYEAQSR
jgi:hypothetical protein